MAIHEEYGQPGREEQEQKDYQELVKKLMYESFESKGFIDAMNVPKLKGRIITFQNDIQYVETDSKEEGKRLIACLGFTLIFRDPETKLEPAQVGDYVEMKYMVHKTQLTMMWTGTFVKKAGE